MKVQVLGLCRFSLLATGGFQVLHETLEDRRRALYDPASLALRFHWFEHVCLPAWRRQTDPDFKLIVATGQDFPAPWLDRLRALIADIPQIVLHQATPERHRPLCRKILRRHTDDGADVVAQFRMDDDDAVAIDYVQRVREDFLQKLVPMYRAEGRIWSDYCRGFTLMTPPEGLTVLPQAADRMTAALTLYKPPSDHECVMDFAHHKLNQTMNGVVFQDSFMYVRGKHGMNDSTAGRFRHDGALLEGELSIPDILRERFAIELDVFEKKVPDAAAMHHPHG
ncbi:glycosyltransferase [Cereibacter sp. SYSU M97828]|nr:glycosyltransferase [Cereibacter flavus]